MLIAGEGNLTDDMQCGPLAENGRHHMDFMEIVEDHALAKAIPMVNVTHPLAKVIHEAAIGSVDKGQFETLMIHGLTRRRR